MKHYNIYKLFINFMAFLSAVLISSPLQAIEATDINQAIRDKGANWVAGETSVSKLSPDEIRRRLMPIKSKNTEWSQLRHRRERPGKLWLMLGLCLHGGSRITYTHYKPHAR
jgi:hypothetical protein